MEANRSAVDEHSSEKHKPIRPITAPKIVQGASPDIFPIVIMTKRFPIDWVGVHPRIQLKRYVAKFQKKMAFSFCHHSIRKSQRRIDQSVHIRTIVATNDFSQLSLDIDFESDLTLKIVLVIETKQRIRPSQDSKAIALDSLNPKKIASNYDKSN